MDEQESGYFTGMTAAEALGVLGYAVILIGAVAGAVYWLL